MLHPARVLTALVVLLLGLLVRSSVQFGPAATGPEAAADPIVLENQPTVEQLTTRWRELDDVEDAHAGYTLTDARGLVQAYAVCRSCNLQLLASRLTRDIWTSDLRRVTAFTVDVAHEGDVGHPVTQHWVPAEDAKKLYDRYGNGLVDPDDAASS